MFIVLIFYHICMHEHHVCIRIITCQGYSKHISSVLIFNILILAPQLLRDKPSFMEETNKGRRVAKKTRRRDEDPSDVGGEPFDAPMEETISFMRESH